MAEEYSNIYTIPPNYTDSGKLLGGMLETRNTVEAVILLVLAGYPQLMWMHLPVTAKVVVMTVTLLPLTVFALMGLGGDSLLQYAAHIVLFWMRRRKLHYRRIGYRYATNTHNKNKRRTAAARAGRAPGPSVKEAAGIRPGVHPSQRDQKRHRGNHGRPIH